jgi:hypothetical protein
MKVTRRSRLRDPFLCLVASAATYLVVRLVITLIDELSRLMELK